MRKRRSSRPWWRWGLTALSVLAALALVVSVRHSASIAACVNCTAPDGSPDVCCLEMMELEAGQLSLCIYRPLLTNPSGRHFEASFQGGYAPVWNWGFSREVDRDDTRVFYRVPLWSVAVLSGLPAAVLWVGYFRRRYGPGQCKKCGYSRRGLAADAKCPECGTTPTPATK